MSLDEISAIEGTLENESASVKQDPRGGERWLAYLNRYRRLVRYIAFSSDVGEAFRPIASKWVVNSTYGIAFAYCIGDVLYNGHKEYKRSTPPNMSNVYNRASRTAVFHTFGSLLIPAVTIHTVVNGANKLTQKSSPRLKLLVPSAAGLFCIPFLPIFVDEPVEHYTDIFFDRFWEELPSEHHHKD